MIRNIVKELLYLYPFRTESAKARGVLPEQPIINHNHPSFTVQSIEKVPPCQNRKIAGWPGRNIWIHVTGVEGLLLENQEIVMVPASGKGVIFDHEDLRGVTNKRGFVEYVHPQKVTYYKLVVDGVWLIDKLWNNREPTYCNPAPWPPGPGGPHGWRPVELPGDGSWRIHIRRKW